MTRKERLSRRASSPPAVPLAFKKGRGFVTDAPSDPGKVAPSVETQDERIMRIPAVLSGGRLIEPVSLGDPDCPAAPRAEVAKKSPNLLLCHANPHG